MKKITNIKCKPAYFGYVEDKRRKTYAISSLTAHSLYRYYCAFMAGLMLPKQINPFQLADCKTALKGDLSLSDMVRLTEIICDKVGKVTIDFQFDKDALGYVYIKGDIKTSVTLICQRCLTPMLLTLEIAVKASPVNTDEQAKQLPADYDPLLLTDDTISLVTMIEEEILLSIPIVPAHSKEACPVKDSSLIEWQEEETQMDNPFSILKKLLRE